jgi:hypothetical protein
LAHLNDGGEKMAEKQQKSPKASGKERIKWETARELGLDDDLQAGGDELSVREAGKIGGNMVKKLVKKGAAALGDHD